MCVLGGGGGVGGGGGREQKRTQLHGSPFPNFSCPLGKVIKTSATDPIDLPTVINGQFKES